MARLPQPGGDEGNWGQILNEYLQVEHRVDGSLRRASEIAQAISDAGGAKKDAADAVNLARQSDAKAGAAQTTADAKYAKPSSGIPETDLSSDVQTKLNASRTSTVTKLDDLSDVTAVSPVNGQVLSFNGTAWTPATPSTSGTISDATATQKGVIQLTGDLGGTAASPTVPGLAQRPLDSQVVHRSGDETVSGIKTFADSPVVPAPVNANQAATKNYVDTQVANAPAATIADGSVATAKLADDAVSEAKLAAAVRTKLNQSSAVTSVAGKTGVVTLAKSDVGLANVDNTTDASKPISTATQAALDQKISTNRINTNSGVAGLDANGKVSVDSLPDAIQAIIVEANGSYPLRSTVTNSLTRPVIWRGATAPMIGSGYAINNVDTWEPTA